MIYANQQAYYVALQESTAESDSAYFITFMLEMILQTVSATPQVSPQPIFASPSHKTAKTPVYNLVTY